jgi:hypothetical protein
MAAGLLCGIICNSDLMLATSQFELRTKTSGFQVQSGAALYGVLDDYAKIDLAWVRQPIVTQICRIFDNKAG